MNETLACLLLLLHKQYAVEAEVHDVDERCALAAVEVGRHPQSANRVRLGSWMTTM